MLVTGFELSTGFPFGFFRLRRRLRARDVEIVVYPKPRPASDELHLLPINAGRMASARRGAGQDLHSLRDYQPHDDVRHIDWKRRRAPTASLCVSSPPRTTAASTSSSTRSSMKIPVPRRRIKWACSEDA